MFKDSEAAERAFYQAIEHSDLTVMTALWETSADCICIHPFAAVLQGFEQILGSWRQIFASEVQLKFQIDPLSRCIQSDLAIHTLHEHITVIGADNQPQPLVATNIYRRSEQGWQMLMHHASPAAGGSVTRPPATHQFH